MEIYLYLIVYTYEQSTHFALAFEVPGGWHQEKDAMTLTVLQVFYPNLTLLTIQYLWVSVYFNFFG